MWRRLLQPRLLRPAASVLALQVWPAFETQPRLPPHHAAHRLQLHRHLGSSFVSCSPKCALLSCNACGEALAHECFANCQRNRSTRICKNCAANNETANRAEHNLPAAFLLCKTCGESLPRDNFSAESQKRSAKTCKSCSANGRPPDKLARIDLGTQSHDCPYCEAPLFPCEGDTFCCGQGKHYVDFTTYYTPPGDALQKLFRQTWTYHDDKGRVVHDARTNNPRITGFSAMSRRYNNLFSLAMHEIQSTTSERELHFGNELRPSNIRIHGTMYRRIWSCTDATPLRYLVLDPTARTERAREQHVKINLLRQLEKLILPQNGYVQVLARLSSTTCRAPAASIEIQWDEGLNELAAIVHETPHADVSARSLRTLGKR